MKKNLFLLVGVIFLSLHNIDAQSNFSIKGKISGVSSGWIYLRYETEENKYLTDSVPIDKEGKFLFRGTISDPVLATLLLKQNSKTGDNSIRFFLESSAMSVKLDLHEFSKFKFSGSKSQDEYASLNSQTEPIGQETRPISLEYDSVSEAYRRAAKNKADETTLNQFKEKLESIREKFEPYNARARTILYRFYDTHPHSYVTAYTLPFHVSELKLEALENYYNKLGLEVQMSIYGKRVEKEVEKLRGGSPGTTAKNFSKADINDDTLSLYNFRGNKYVLLDFWASWCVPCRKGNPHLKEVYQIYREKGLEIIGVSDDDNAPEKWRKAVQEDALPWRHILRGIDWEKIRKKEKNENDINENFGIHTLPTKILIDKNGVIIGRYDETEDGILDAKLNEIFGG